MILINNIFDNEYGDIAYVLSENKYLYVKIIFYKNSFIYEELPTEIQKELFSKYNVEEFNEGENYENKTR